MAAIQDMLPAAPARSACHTIAESNSNRSSISSTDALNNFYHPATLARDHIHKNGHGNSVFRAHIAFSHHIGHKNTTFRARFVLTDSYIVIPPPSAKRMRAHFTESVKRMSGKSTCGEANDRLCLMTLGRRSRTKRKSCLSSRCERNE